MACRWLSALIHSSTFVFKSFRRAISEALRRLWRLIAKSVMFMAFLRGTLVFSYHAAHDAMDLLSNKKQDKATTITTDKGRRLIFHRVGIVGEVFWIGRHHFAVSNNSTSALVRQRSDEGPDESVRNFLIATDSYLRSDDVEAVHGGADNPEWMKSNWW